MAKNIDDTLLEAAVRLQSILNTVGDIVTEADAKVNALINLLVRQAASDVRTTEDGGKESRADKVDYIKSFLFRQGQTENDWFGDNVDDIDDWKVDVAYNAAKAAVKIEENVKGRFN